MSDAPLPLLVVAFCTYKRAHRLPALVAALRAQESPVPFGILAVNNNSPDDTLAVLEELSGAPGAPLTFVTEFEQGIVAARNRALTEADEADFLIFIDDDEMPEQGLVANAYHALTLEGADCVGGRVRVDFAGHHRPRWLSDELLGFLAEVDYGPEPFWIENDKTPIWTANIAYRMAFLRKHGLRFDARYSRIGNDIGGGEDAIMFRALLAGGARIRYRPDMITMHYVEDWRLQRGYFLRLHYRAGLRRGRYELPTYDRLVLGFPPFLLGQIFAQLKRALLIQFTRREGALRQWMNVMHAIGCARGYAAR